MNYLVIHYFSGGVWFLVFGGLLLMEQEKRKHEDGTYSPKTLLSYILGLLFFGPLVIGMLVGWETMWIGVIFPPFAMTAFVAFLFG